ncbi:uncharacterized protein LOC111259943 isoform X2 [Varroa jacobsoni]|uniref:uncharacterized protein LOC111259943 isoform X2 n=1 Tax=Varroa jacobsoni TaxID=62625 RepID=UPI000BF374FE|nr:uncharacterized protein LOC111259943 isoform X2 [Varroa jacobsoni]
MRLTRIRPKKLATATLFHFIDNEVASLHSLSSVGFSSATTTRLEHVVQFWHRHRQSRMESRKFSLTSNERRLTAQTRFFVDEELAKLSPVLSRMICMPSDRPLQLKSVDATTLALIREWLEHHRSQKSRPDGKLPRDNWDYWFISEVAAGDLLHELIMMTLRWRRDKRLPKSSDIVSRGCNRCYPIVPLKSGFVRLPIKVTNTKKTYHRGDKYVK